MLDEDESRLIDVVRVLCITSMMWVHVNPGPSVPSIVNVGEFHWIGLFLSDVLGRMSVCTLTFVSGYLFWKMHVFAPLPVIIGRLVRGLVIPMVLWGMVFLVLAFAKAALLGPSTAIEEINSTPLGYLNAVFGLSGHTANESLFFLRDLVVATILLRLMWRVVMAAPLVAVCAVIALTSFVDLQPLLFRSSILVFLTLGAATARLGSGVANLSRPEIAVPAAAIVAIAYVAIVIIGSRSGTPAPEIAGMLRRIGLMLLALVAARALLFTAAGDALAGAGRHMYLAYLAHVPLFGVAWAVWQHAAGGPLQESYVIFYVASPIVAIGVAVVAGTLIDRAPPALQKLIRGRAVRRRIPALAVPQ